ADIRDRLVVQDDAPGFDEDGGLHVRHAWCLPFRSGPMRGARPHNKRLTGRGRLDEDQAGWLLPFIAVPGWGFPLSLTPRPLSRWLSFSSWGMRLTPARQSVATIWLSLTVLSACRPPSKSRIVLRETPARVASSLCVQ